MSYRNFLDEIKNGLPSPNYILISSDPFLHSEAVSLIKNIMPQEKRDFNFHSFDILNTDKDKISFEQILDVLNTVPFFSDRKFVIIENFQKFPKKEFKKLEQYLVNPSLSSVMVMLNTGAVKKEFKVKIKGVRQITLDIRTHDIPFWLKEKAKTKGFEISSKAIEYMIGTLGPELGLLSSELDKFLFLGKSTIEKEDILEIIRGNRAYSPFDLVNAIMDNDTERVFTIYNVLRNTEEPYSLLGVLNWQYNRLLSNKNTPRDKIFASNIFNILNKADIQIKSSGSYYPLELLLVKLLRISKKQ
jgi:DNA polymerase-3 subunit delta